MKSERLACRRREVLHLHPTKKKKRGVLLWASLPSELLSVISGCLEDAADIIRFRSVCRSWRISTPLLHKVSPFFPFVFSISADERETEIHASAVYLLRPRRDPSKAWMVHAQESAPGKLIFRHPLSLSDLSDEKWPNLSSDEWSSVTQIATSYNHFTTCSRCKDARPKIKFALVTPSSSNRRSGSDQLIRLGLKIIEFTSFFAYCRGGGGGDPTTGKWLHPHRRLSDFIVFNGQIYACEYNGVLYVLDHTKVELIPLIPACNIARPGMSFWMRLVVWDGGLYAVVMYPDLDLADCYRLVEDEGNCRWEKVEDLGDGVLFITRDCVFSMSARDLPPPWRGNSIVVAHRTWTTCCIGIILVYELGVESGQSKPISSFPGYSELFAPPLTRS